MSLKASWGGFFSIVSLLLFGVGAIGNVHAETRPISGLDTGAVASFMCSEAPAGSTLPEPEPVFHFPPEFQIEEPTGVCGESRLEGEFSGTFYFVATAIGMVVNANGVPEIHVTSLSEFYPDTGGVLFSGEYDLAVINMQTLEAHHALSISTESIAEVEPGEGPEEIDNGHIFIKGSFSSPLFKPIFNSNGELIDLIAEFEGTYHGFLRGDSDDGDSDDKDSDDEDTDDEDSD